jgi:D-alanyl-D-alanine carboxypeptidase
MRALSLSVDLEQALEDGARLGAVVVAGGVEQLAIDPVGRYPLASVRKVVTLGGYALAVACEAWDPAEPVALRDIDRWFWPDTDGGAHERARRWWTESEVLRPGREASVPLQEIALATIRFSDNAAADYLLHRLGDQRVTEAGQQMGLMTQDPILPTLGEFRGWHRCPEQWSTTNAADRARTAWELATSEASNSDAVQIDEATQRRCAAVGCQGTAREWARLMAGLAAGTCLPKAAQRIVREALERPSAPEGDGRFGAKAGDLPGILTFAGYVRDRPSGTPDVAVAMFLRGLDGERLHRLSVELPKTAAELLGLSEALSRLN